jgi:hypothetical protein
MAQEIAGNTQSNEQIMARLNQLFPDGQSHLASSRELLK